MIYIGVDPGLSGAIAFYNTATGALGVKDMPTFTLTRNARAKREINVTELASIVDELVGGRDATKAVVESVGAAPGQGVSSMFAFGKSFGIVLGVLGAHFIPVELVTPPKWKKHFNLAGKGKDASRATATMLFPHQSGLFARVKDDGRAEAVLLAVYGADIGGK